MNDRFVVNAVNLIFLLISVVFIPFYAKEGRLFFIGVLVMSVLTLLFLNLNENE